MGKLPVTGTVDKATWYAIKRYYNGVKQLAELVSEGITIEEATLPYPTEGLRLGMQGAEIRTLQYYLDIISYFNPALELIPINGVFDQRTDYHVCSDIAWLDCFNEFTVAVIYHTDDIRFDLFDKGDQLSNLIYRKGRAGLIAF